MANVTPTRELRLQCLEYASRVVKNGPECLGLAQAMETWVLEVETEKSGNPAPVLKK